MKHGSTIVILDFVRTWLLVGVSVLAGAFWLLVVNLPVCGSLYPTILRFDANGLVCRAQFPGVWVMLRGVQSDPAGSFVLVVVVLFGVAFLGLLFKLVTHFLISYVRRLLLLTRDVGGSVAAPTVTLKLNYTRTKARKI